MHVAPAVQPRLPAPVEHGGLQAKGSLDFDGLAEKHRDFLCGVHLSGCERNRAISPLSPYNVPSTTAEGAPLTSLDKSSRSLLFPGNAGHFSGDTLFDRIARAVCEAGCLPRKELYEAWETARRVRRKMRGGPVVELAAGHGLLSAILILLDDTTDTAICVDIQQPPSHASLLAVLEKHWPRLAGRIRFASSGIEAADIPADALLASVHACGSLTDRVLDLAIEHRCRVAVLPCCHDLKTCDTGELDGWMDGPLAVDATRAARLRRAGFRVRTAAIPPEITPKNRLLLGWPEQ